MEGAELEGSCQLLKAVRVSSLMQRESLWPYARCISVDICNNCASQSCKATATVPGNLTLQSKRGSGWKLEDEAQAGGGEDDTQTL